jgi:hypothetical protein
MFEGFSCTGFTAGRAVRVEARQKPVPSILGLMTGSLCLLETSKENRPDSVSDLPTLR